MAFMRSALAIFLFFQFGCVTSTRLISSDPDSSIVNTVSKEIKESPQPELIIKDNKPFWSSTSVTIMKEGCEDSVYLISKADEFYPESAFMAILGSVYLGPVGLFPLLWTTTYENSYRLDYSCKKVTKK